MGNMSKKIIQTMISLAIFSVLTAPTAVYAATNMIANPNVENSKSGVPNNWSNSYWGDLSATFSYISGGHNSNKALKVEVTSVGAEGDAKWYFKDVAVSANTTYVFSDYYKSDVTSTVIARFKVGTGYTYVQLDTASSSSDWKKFEKTFTAPSGATAVTIFHLISSVGYLVTDDFSLSVYTDPNSFDKGMVSFTFDDGWLSVYKNAIPILNAAGFKSTQYIISDYVAGDNLYVSTTQIKEMHDAGHEIGSHTKSHAHLLELTTAQKEDEIIGSKTVLESLGLGPINSIAFPYGEYDNEVLSIVQRAYNNSRTALIADGGYNTKITNKFLLKTFSIEKATTLASVKSIIDAAAKNKTWAILVFHQVERNGGTYSVTPTFLQNVVNYTKTKGVDVVTISQGVAKY